MAIIPDDIKQFLPEGEMSEKVEFIPIGQIDNKVREFDFSQPNQMFFLPSVLDKHRFSDKLSDLEFQEFQDMALFFDKDQERPLVPKTNGVFYMAFDRENGHVFGNPIASNYLVSNFIWFNDIE